jgi:microcystin-dependent protein
MDAPGSTGNMLDHSSAPAPTGSALAQVEIFAFGFAPTGFAACQGQLLPIAQNQELFSLLGTRYGGNGLTDFALPKLPPLTPEGPFYFICIAAS